MKLTRNNLLLALGAALSVGGYLLASHFTFRVGFPLDDAWIHQTYARNLALWGEWSFWRGQVSGGSTAPLWSLLLALGYLFKRSPYLWTFFLGTLLFWALAALGESFMRKTMPSYQPNLPWMGIFLLGEWHLIWAAASGMETLLYALIVTAVLLSLALGRRNFIVYGVLIGVSLWVRPGGVTLLGPVVVVILFSGQGAKKMRLFELFWGKSYHREHSTPSSMLTPAGMLRDHEEHGVLEKKRAFLCGLSELRGENRNAAPQKRREPKMFQNLLGLGISFGIFLAFYFLFNLLVTGTPYPNTFYAKQAEYAILRELSPLWLRFLREASLPFIGAGALLLPGALFYGWHAIRRRQVGVLVGMLWFLGYAALYAWKLPVTYQHGRYMIPAMPIFFVWGFVGTYQFLRLIPATRWGNLAIFGGRLALLSTCLAFYGLGARSFAWDVAFIETEMVAAANWTRTHLPQDALIAAHDIGALGYFDGRELVDLAGLVSPEVIPFIRDEEKLASYLEEEDVDYLIVFPSWYETLSEDLPLVYNTGGAFAPILGGENMNIYQWLR